MQYKGDLFTITNACCTFQQKCYFCQSYYLYSVLSCVVIGNCGNFVLKVPLIKQLIVQVALSTVMLI